MRCFGATIVFLAGLAMAAAPLWAQTSAGPATAPSDGSDRLSRPGATTQPRREGRFGGPAGGPGNFFGGRMRGNFQLPMPPEEREATRAFAREQMPNLDAMWQSAAFGTPTRRRLQYVAYTQYQRLLAVKKEHPDVQEATLKQIHTLDGVFGLARDYSAASAPAARDALKNAMRQKVHDMAAGLLDDRRARIERLKASLAKEETKLNADQKQVDVVIDQQLDRFLKALPTLFEDLGTLSTTLPTEETAGPPPTTQDSDSVDQMMNGMDNLLAQ